jgi:hypothetical protein
MITSSDPKSNAMLLALQMQRDAALEQTALLAGDVAEARASLAAEQAKSASLQERLDALKPKEAA